LAFDLATTPPPWPPAPNALPPLAPCGQQRPGLNVAPAIAADGTIVTVSRAHFNPGYSYLVALNPDLSVKWVSGLRDHLRDGCGVLLPPSGTIGGCREGTADGVDPTTNQLPAGQVLDQSTASPAIAPDGAIFFGVSTAHNSFRGHLMKFSAAGEYLSAYDFGWDTTPAIFAHDHTYSIVLKNNHYGARSYCGVDPFCLRDDERFELVSLTAGLQTEWHFVSTNNLACERLENGTRNCVARPNGFEWCVNMVAMDRDGVMFANSEDGSLYAIDRTGKQVGSIFLKVATGASYTPLAIGADGRIYTQNAGTLFVVGSLPAP
jgi:outer membrane protein assembly factor BamB